MLALQHPRDERLRLNGSESRELRASVTDGLFISYSNPPRGVFESQVLEYGTLARSLGVNFRYVLFEGYRTWLRSRDAIREHLARLRSDFGVDVEMHYLPTPIGRLGLRLGAAVVAGAARRTSGRCVLQARDAAAGWVALEAKRRLRSAVVLYDARGDGPAEARMSARQADDPKQRTRWERRADRLEVLERRVCAEADHLLAVSQKLADHLRHAAKVDDRDVTVVPCCINPSRFIASASLRAETRRTLGIEDRFVFVYAGSLSQWQAPDMMASLMEAICERRPTAHLLVLSHDQAEAARAFAKLVARGACTIKACAYADVPRHLAAADAALLVREDDPVNRVACPVKFAEYQACGLPVVSTPMIGDVSDYIRTTGFGVVIEGTDTPVRQAEAVLAAIERVDWAARRDDISRTAVTSFSLQTYQDAYRALFGRLGVAGA